MGDTVKVYTVNGSSTGSTSSLPDWLTRKRAAKGRSKKRAIREQVESTIDLIQHFEFPEASNRIKTTRDGKHAIATGTYKPQMRVWDLDELALKFERHSDAENIDFVILSDDWTKTVHLQTDRTIELHNQGGLHYRTRIPRFGRSIAYHFPSCDTLISASSPEVYRLNLEQGRFLAPLNMNDSFDEEVEGVNVIDINPVHHLLSFGLDGPDGVVQFWDPRSRSRVGILRLPAAQITPLSSTSTALSITALASKSDGLSFAVGTSTGYTLLYDIRSTRPFAIKDQGYGLPVKDVLWVEGGSKMAGDGNLVITADSKVIKIWDRNTPKENFASITPPTSLNALHHIPSTGLLMHANEGIQMHSYYIPQLGPAPRWCSWLDNITEEMEGSVVRSVYEDFKFVQRSELVSLGLDNLLGTPALKPYMHGYFLSLRLYDAARLISNPFAYNEHREKVVKDKMDKLAESRIRTRKDGMGSVKVNKKLAERLRRDEEREERKRHKGAVVVNDGGEDAEMEVEVEEVEKRKKKKTPSNLLSDSRFKDLFENPEFEVDEGSREFGMLNPSTLASSSSSKRRKTAVEEEDEESDKASSDGLSHSESSDEDRKGDSDDSSDAGDLNLYDPRARTSTGARLPTSDNQKKNGPRLVAVRPTTTSGRPTQISGLSLSKDASFKERKEFGRKAGVAGREDGEEGDYIVANKEGGMELSWTPSSSKDKGREKEKEGRPSKVGKKIDSFGAGMERGGGGARKRDESTSEEMRKGRSVRRREGVRWGNKNAFREM